MDLTSDENSSPENRELARVIRKLGGLFPRYSEIDWTENRRRCCEILAPLIEESDQNRGLIDLLDGVDYEVGGDEHHILRVESDPERIYKMTHGDNFGCRSYFSATDPELTGCHFHGETNADPFFYLRRWMLLNSMGGYQTRFEGFVPAAHPQWLPRICISQPELDGHNPSVAEIRRSLGEYGIWEVSQAAYFHPESGLLLTDAAPRNIRIVDGIPVPFDAIAQIPTEQVRHWCHQRLGLPAK